ncbi:transcriptional regulator, partial [Lacticaseibacillus rhamnosus]
MGHKSGLWRFETRSPAQKSACKDLSRNGQGPA